MSKTTDLVVEEDTLLSDAINIKNLRHHEIVEAFKQAFGYSDEEAERHVDMAIQRCAW